MSKYLHFYHFWYKLHFKPSRALRSRGLHSLASSWFIGQSIGSIYRVSLWSCCSKGEFKSLIYRFWPHMSNFKSHISQFKSHITHFKSHITQFKSHIAQSKSHISQFKSHISQIEAHITHFKSHISSVRPNTEYSAEYSARMHRIFGTEYSAELAEYRISNVGEKIAKKWRFSRDIW